MTKTALTKHWTTCIMLLTVVCLSITLSGNIIVDVSATLVRVVDGDTLVVTLSDGREERVRLIGIDTPETVHPRKDVEPWGPEASAFVKALLPEGQRLRMELDVQQRDIYGRLLAYVYLPQGPMLNMLLLSAGLAQVATFPPNVKYVDLFLSLQSAAREAQLGIWGAGLQVNLVGQGDVTITANLLAEPQPGWYFSHWQDWSGTVIGDSPQLDLQLFGQEIVTAVFIEDDRPRYIDLNTASFEELQEIVHIGTVNAQEIIDRRPWVSVEDLIILEHIGEKRLRDILEQGRAWVD